MPLKIVRDDMAEITADAIVSTADSALSGANGAAEAAIAGTPPCRYEICTEGPVWRGGGCGERERLAACYKTSLELAMEQGCRSAAVPLITSRGYPKAEALRTAVESIGDFLLENDMTVYLVIFDRAAYRISDELFADIAEYIDENFAGERFGAHASRACRQSVRTADTAPACAYMMPAAHPAPDLTEAVERLDESFSQMLLRKIDEKGLTDAECYKKANIDRKLFSKIRGDRLYRPSKATALAFAIALELPLSETQDMLMKAGYALSRSSKADVIVENFIRRGNYSVFEINEALFAFDQSLLGE